MRTALAWISLALCFIVCLGWPRGVRPGPKPRASPVSEAEADFQSGPDGVPQGAVVMIPRTDVAPELSPDACESDGEVSWPAKKRTQWRRAEVSHKPTDPNTPLRCELRYEPQNTELVVDAWNAAQTPLPEHHQSAPGLYVTEVFLEKEAPVYLRVRAMRPDHAARFKLRCGWEQLIEYEVVSRGRGGRPRPSPKPERIPTLEDLAEKGTEGRIITSTKEAGRMMLHLDKGAAAGVKVGQAGTLLEGRSGRSPLEGGSFKVIKVLGDAQCMAESSVRSIGRNIRVVFFLK